MAGRIGFIGLGRMGRAMAERLLEAGFELVVWNRTRSVAEEFARSHPGSVSVADSPRGVAEAAGVVHVMVSDDEASRSVALGGGGYAYAGREGLVVVDHSTLTPAHTVFMEKVLGEKGIAYVEAPVIGGPRAARRGELIILYAGKERPEGLESLKPLGRVVDLGEIPRAAAAKLAFNNVLLVSLAGLAESLALVEAYGVDARWYAKNVLGETWARVLVERFLERGLRLDAPASFRAVLAGKDAAYAAEALRLKGMPGLLASATESYYSLMTGEGYGDSDYPALIAYLLARARRAAKG